MGSFCCPGNVFATLARAAAKSAAAKLRALGRLPQADDWARRAGICETCSRKIIYRGTSYCGNPLLRQIDRDPVEDGCGCPCGSKAKDPSEHCPITVRHEPSQRNAGRCDCKWCVSAA